MAAQNQDFAIEPAIAEKFISQYTLNSLSAHENVAQVNIKGLKEHEGEKVATIDIGADKYLVTVIAIIAAGPKQIEPVEIHFLKDGNILETLADLLSKHMQKHAIQRIAVSSHGEIQNNLFLQHGPPALLEELANAKTSNDLGLFLRSKLGQNLGFSMYNDAVSGGAFGFFMNHLLKPDTKHLIYFIVGGGIGGCYVNEHGQISSAEPGHIAWIPYPDDPQADRCPQAGAPFCAEVYGKGPYLETKLATKYLGQEVPGREMDRRLEAGDETVKSVYVHGARNAAHVLLGLLNGFGLFDKEKLAHTAVVTHGGVPDNVHIYNPLLEQFVMQYLQHKFGSLPSIPITSSQDLQKDLGENTGALGAALLAF